jgi:P27 family predicted phage terminase small subunit
MRGRKPDKIVMSADALNDVPNPPTWLGKDAKAEWKRVAPILIVERKTLSIADQATFAAYCSAVGEISEAARIIEREGMIFIGASGPKKHPAVAIKSDAMTQARLLANELGLTPVSRSRPSIRDEGGADEDASALGL